MSDQNLDEFIRIAADEFPKYLAGDIWPDLWQDRCEVVASDGSTYPHGYWKSVLARVERVGLGAALLVPYTLIGDSIARWQYNQERGPDFLEIQRLEGRPTGGGIGYVATVNGLDVFTAQLAPTHSYLFSTRKVESITYRWVEPNNFVTVQFEQGDDPAHSRLPIRFSQKARFPPFP